MCNVEYVCRLYNFKNAMGFKYVEPLISTGQEGISVCSIAMTQPSQIFT